MNILWKWQIFLFEWRFENYFGNQTTRSHSGLYVEFICKRKWHGSSYLIFIDLEWVLVFIGSTTGIPIFHYQNLFLHNNTNQPIIAIARICCRAALPTQHLLMNKHGLLEGLQIMQPNMICSSQLVEHLYMKASNYVEIVRNVLYLYRYNNILLQQVKFSTKY